MGPVERATFLSSVLDGRILLDILIEDDIMAVRRVVDARRRNDLVAEEKKSAEVSALLKKIEQGKCEVSEEPCDICKALYGETSHYYTRVVYSDGTEEKYCPMWLWRKYFRMALSNGKVEKFLNANPLENMLEKYNIRGER